MDLKKVPNRSQGKETYRETSAVQMVTIFFFFGSSSHWIIYLINGLLYDINSLDGL